MAYKQKQISSNHKKSTLLIAVVLIMLLVAGSGAAWVFSKRNDAKAPTAINTVNYDPPTKAEKEAGEQTKLENIENKGANEPSKPSDPRVVIGKLYQDGSTKQVVAQTELYGGHWKTCTITFSKGAETLTKTAETLFQTAYSSCMGFAIPASEFSSEGTWQVILSAETTEGTILKSETKNVTVTK